MSREKRTRGHFSLNPLQKQEMIRVVAWGRSRVTHVFRVSTRTDQWISIDRIYCLEKTIELCRCDELCMQCYD